MDPYPWFCGAGLISASLLRVRREERLTVLLDTEIADDLLAFCACDPLHEGVRAVKVRSARDRNDAVLDRKSVV